MKLCQRCLFSSFEPLPCSGSQVCVEALKKFSHPKVQTWWTFFSIKSNTPLWNRWASFHQQNLAVSLPALNSERSGNAIIQMSSSREWNTSGKPCIKGAEQMSLIKPWKNSLGCNVQCWYCKCRYEYVFLGTLGCLILICAQLGNCELICWNWCRTHGDGDGSQLLAFVSKCKQLELTSNQNICGLWNGKPFVKRSKMTFVPNCLRVAWTWNEPEWTNP